ncbi:MAG TPA: nucleoside phosphorylase [Candidatus Acidoferrum sp.]|jgi:uridine phosphorylase|nr:nucleoside phosphorylase [Candidatus Acidoferrum sp.]
MHKVGSGRKQMHILCSEGDLAEYLLVPGDPNRVSKIASFWEKRKQVSSSREFCSMTGKYKGVPISALSSGIGPASVAIAFNEAANIGVGTFIRVGSTGAIQHGIECGDVVLSSAAVRLDGTSNCYIMPEYPAAASYEVLLALIQAAEDLDVTNYHVGVTATTADFYAGQSRPMQTGISRCENMLPELQKANVLNFEMETATLFTLASLRGLRAGSVCAVYANRSTNVFKDHAGEETAIRIANEAVRILNVWDRLKQRRKKRWFFPSLVKKE